MNLFLLITRFLPSLPFGHIIEYGSYRGGSAFFFGILARKYLPGVRVFALDTFEGMPETDGTVDAHRPGDFAGTSDKEVVSARDQLGLDNVEIVKGLFEHTAPRMLEQAKPIALAHIDCDIYEAVKYSYRISKPYMVPMGYYVFDDATSASCIGATEAVEEAVVQNDGLLSEQVFPHHVFRHAYRTWN
jgi:hypothetical protein